MARHTLWEDPEIGIELARFAPKEWHRNHADRFSRITLALQGEFNEVTGVGSASVAAGDMLFKSRSVRHENHFGDGGTTVVSIVFRRDDVCALEQVGLRRPWAVRRSAHHLRSSIAILEASFANDGLTIHAAISDLLSSEIEADQRSVSPPAWLNRLKADLEMQGLATVDVAQRARDAGVHPAHASRMFRRAFSTSITEHATYHCVRRAIGMLGLEEQELSEIAVAAGFYDQSHMGRTFCRLTGSTPGRYRRLINRVSMSPSVKSVQS